MRILHPTDFSRTAELAHVLAVDLARRASADLHVVHVQERFDDRRVRGYIPAQSERINPVLQRQIEEERATETRRLRERLAAVAREHATHELVWGSVLRELLRLAAEHDLVVMGAHGNNPFDEVFLGGVAGRLVRRTTTPVLTVRDTTTTTRVQRLLVATDFHETALAAWSFATHLAQRSGIKLVLAHVDEGHHADARTATDRLEALAGDRAERFVVRAGHPVDVLPKLAEEVGADAIVVGLKRHGSVAGLLLGARADALVRSSRVPVLSVPATL
jgi:nucleotide-binding universal stress UspA family protein